MSMSINIHRRCVCDPLGLYISLVNNFISPITLINYLHQQIDSLIKDRFNPIDRLSCQPIGCQATPHTLEAMEYIRTPLWNLFIFFYHVCIILHSHETHE